MKTTFASPERTDSDKQGSGPSADPDPPQRTEAPTPAAAPSAATPIEVRCADPGDPAAPDLPWLAARLAEAAAIVAAPLRELTVTLVGDAAMRRLHRRWLGPDEPTDVLTFRHSPPGEPIEADVVVCTDEARRRGAVPGRDARRELLLYALHGLLHCAGRDDAEPGAFEAMHAEEDRILSAIGVGATFRPTREASRG